MLILPFLKIKIGSPLFPWDDQSFLEKNSLFTLVPAVVLSSLGSNVILDFVVLPNLIEFPNLPSIITSPAKDNKGLILLLGSKLPPIKGEL